MIFLVIFLLVFLSSLAQCTKLSDPAAIQQLRDSLSSDEHRQMLYEAEFLIFDKFNGNDIRRVLDQVNDIKRGTAYYQKWSNSGLLHYDENLEKMAENVTCGSRAFLNDFNFVIMFSNDVDVLREGIETLGENWQVHLNWFVAIFSPHWHSIGCAPKECDLNGYHYEMTCVMQATEDSLDTKNGWPGSDCKDGWNDGGLCNNGASSIFSTFLVLVLMIVSAY